MFFYSLPLYPFLHLLSISFIFPISLFQVIQISLIWSFSIHFSFCICQSSSSLFLPVSLTPNLFMSFSSHFARFSLTKVAGGMSRSNVQIVLGSIHGFTPCNSLYGKARLHEKLICSFLSATSHAIPEIIGFLQLQNNIRIVGITRILSTLFVSSRKRKNTLDILCEAKWKLYSTTNLHSYADLNDDYLLFTAPIKSKARKIPHGVPP